METATLHEINIKGIEALKKVLDPLELVRFFQQYDLGNGNYTEERREKYKNIKAEEIYKSIKSRRKSKRIKN